MYNTKDLHGKVIVVLRALCETVSDLSAQSASKAVETKTNDILAMISPEGERVALTKVR